MKRRAFLKTAMAAGASAVLPGAWAEKPDAAWMRTGDAALTALAANVALRGVSLPGHMAGVRTSRKSGVCGARRVCATGHGGQWRQCLAAARDREEHAPYILHPTARGRPAARGGKAERNQLGSDTDGGADRRHRVGDRTESERRSFSLRNLQRVQPMGCLASALSRYARHGAGRGLLHLRHRPGQQSALGGSFRRMSGPRCEEVFSGAVGAEAMPGPLGGGLWRQGCAERHGGGTRQNDRGQKWTDDAERIRSLILEKLWCEEDASFYDVAPDGSFVRIRSVANCRVLGEHVLRPNVPRERKIFEALWVRQLHNPEAYWARYPLPSIAMDDPKFRAADSAQFLGRGLAGAHRAANAALDGILRQGARAAAADGTLERGDSQGRRLLPADGPGDRRLYPARSRWLFAMCVGVSALCEAIGARGLNSWALFRRPRGWCFTGSPRRFAW